MFPYRPIWCSALDLQLISNTGKYERGLSQLLHVDRHWFYVPQRVQYKLAVTVHCCLRNQAPSYLADHCVPVSDVAGRSVIWDPLLVINWLYLVSAASPLALVHSLLLQGPTVWNSLPISDIQLWDQNSFGVTWKPICLVSALRRQRSRCFYHHLSYTHVHLPAYHLLTHY